MRKIFLKFQLLDLGKGRGSFSRVSVRSTVGKEKERILIDPSFMDLLVSPALGVCQGVAPGYPRGRKSVNTNTHGQTVLFHWGSLSEPHSCVLTWLIVTCGIYLFESTVRPLGFVLATIAPKFRANPILRRCPPLALIDDDFLSNGCLRESPVRCFFTQCIGCSAAL